MAPARIIWTMIGGGPRCHTHVRGAVNDRLASCEINLSYWIKQITYRFLNWANIKLGLDDDSSNIEWW